MRADRKPILATAAVAGVIGALVLTPGARAATPRATGAVPAAGVGPASSDPCIQPAGNPPPGSQAWEERDAGNVACATQRQHDEQATYFDGSADTSSIGAGTFDPAAAAADPSDPAAGNVPYKIGGDCVSDLLSFYYYSGYWLAHGRVAANDLQGRGCPK